MLPASFGARRTIAFFSSSPGGLLHFEKSQMWRGIVEAAQERDANLLYIAGEEFEYHPQALLYRLLDASNVDGIIFWDSFVSHNSHPAQVRAFLQRFQPLPVVSIEISLDDCISVVVDNYQGMHDVIAHLITVHGYRRIAYASPAPTRSSLLRRAAFEEVMQQHGLYDPRLIGAPEDFDQRGLRPGLDYQAVIVNTDQGAVNFIEALQRRGVRVPEDVAVTGFNDGQEARGMMPPLTTLRLPFRLMGRQAAELLLQKINGAPAAELTCIPLRLILRRSCGCLDPLAEQAAVGSLPSPVQIPPADFAAADFAARREAIIADMARGMGVAAEDQAPGWSARIYDSFFIELTVRRQLAQQPGASSLPLVRSNGFLGVLNDILQEAISQGINVNRWHEALTTMRRHLLARLQETESSLAEGLWHQARVLIGQSAARAEVHRNWQVLRRLAVLREIETSLQLTDDLSEVIDILTQGLPRLGILGCSLALYEEPSDPLASARLALAYHDGQRLAESEIRAPASRLLFPEWLQGKSRYSLLVEDIHFRDEQIGFIAFEGEPSEMILDGMSFDVLQTQLSDTLKGVRLRQQLHEAVRRAEEANQLKSRFLSMVSHELRTPINLIVGLSEMALRERLRSGPGSLEIMRKYHEQIYTSGQHLDRLIRDVLDLASSQVGKMDLVCSAIELSPLLSEVAVMGRQLAEPKNLAFVAAYPDKLPLIWGDKTRLRQVLLNLISNAVKFTAHGEVALRAWVERQEIFISVSDTGLGISLAEQDKIFDEFQQSERTTARGYGGIGLGLAIARRLVEMHSGRIWVTSSGVEGEGSTFCFALPVWAEAAVTDLPHHDRSGVVLVITSLARGHKRDSSDEESPRAPEAALLGEGQALSYHLKRQGFLVEELALEESPDYFNYLVVSPPGAVVLDLAPASEQGWEIIRVLKGHPATRDIPVLFYSLVEEQNSGSVLEMEYLTKPISAEELIHTLDRHGLRSAARKGRKTILLVDDDPHVLDLHTQIVRSARPEYSVLTANDGRSALAMMSQNHPDLVLLDLLMPELDGFGVLKAMQEDKALRGTPVIILSAQVLTEREMALLNQGVAAVLGKGLFTAKETLERIETALSHSKRLGSEAQRMVRQAMAYIHTHYAEPIDRSDLARHLNINEQYLTRCFNREIGVSPIVYLNRCRIEQAKRMLEQGKYSITQVALSSGFSNQSYFSRIFQREVGVSPRAYQHGERNAS